MKIESLANYYPMGEGSTVILESTENTWAFPSGLNRVEFAFDFERIDFQKHQSLILINPTNSIMTDEVQSFAMRTTSNFEVWFLREDLEALRAFIEGNDNLAIYGIHLSDEWLHMSLGPAKLTSRDTKDLETGMRIPTFKPEPQIPQSESPRIQVTWRSLLISELIPIAKPLKKYLPGRVVFVLYRILEKLR